jgi:integrase
MVFSRAIAPALKDIKHPDMHVHDLRHFCGTYTAIAGGTLADNMTRLGHSTVKASLVYQSAVDDRQHVIAAKLSELAQG